MNMNISIDRKAYDEGFQSGLTWKDAWEGSIPGGPWVPSLGYRNDAAWVAIHEKAAAERSDWLIGWEAGHAAKGKL